MTTGGRRDASATAAGIAAWLRHERRSGSIRVVDVAHPSEGMSNETIVVTVAGDGGDGGEAGGAPADRPPERLVVRLPPLHASFPDLDLGIQADLHPFLASHGVPAPVPVVHVTDESWLGSEFLVMPFVAGHVPGQAPPFDSWLTDAGLEAQRAVEDAFLDTLTKLHRIEWQSGGPADRLRGATGTSRDEVAWWQSYVAWATDGPPLPRLADLLDWCLDHCPTREPRPSLLWGDARLGNTIFTDDHSLRAALDWETASIGPPETDLAWYLAMDAALQAFTGGATVPGFRDHDAFVGRYEELLGRPSRDLAWHEIFAVARSICITYRQAEVAKLAGARPAMPGDERHPMFNLVDRWIERWEPGARRAPAAG